jgi:hypothetical protein
LPLLDAVHGTTCVGAVADARRRPIPAPVDAATLTGQVLDRIGMEIRLAQLVAAKHAVSGCPSPASCPPCEGGRRRLAAEDLRQYHERDALGRVEAIRQHHESASRLAARTPSPRARRLARDAALLSATAAIKPGAKCAVCATTPGGRRCRSCAAESATPGEIHAVIESARGAGRQPPQRRRPTMRMTYRSDTSPADIRAVQGMLGRLTAEDR